MSVLIKSINPSLTPVVSCSIGVTLIAVFFLASLPQSASALSCLNPTEMIPTYATDDSYTVARVTAGALDTFDGTHDQEVVVQAVYKGELSANATVSFAYDKTWNYLCAGEPAKEGSESIYVLRDNHVSQTFAIDGELTEALLAELGEPKAPSGVPVDNTPEEADRKSLMQQIIILLQQIVSLFGGSTEVPTEPVLNYIGLRPIEAADYAESKNDFFRVVEIDGEPQAVTEDYRPGRINAVVQNGVVTSYTVEGQETQPVEPPQPEETADYIGLTVDEAQALAKTNGVPFRIGTVDGEPRPVTMDYRPGRITATIADNVVIDYSVEGGII